MRTRYILITGLVTIALAAGGYSLAWHRLAGAVRSDVEAWARARSAAGLETGFQALAIDGYPFSLRLRIDAPFAALSHAAPHWRWEGQAIAVTTRPWAMTRFEITPVGAHRLAGPANIVFQAASAIAALVLDDDGRSGQLNIELTGLTMQLDGDPEPSRIEVASLSLERPPPAAHGDKGLLLFALDAGGINAPRAARGPLGSDVERLLLEGHVPMPPRGDQAAITSLGAWLAAGGVVEVETLELRWGGLELSAAGTLTLDDQMRPLAAFNARVQDYARTLEAFAAQGILTAREAAIARTVFDLLARRSGDGSLEIPITAQDGRLFVGPVALVPVPALPLE